jgi:hypothetical protein
MRTKTLLIALFILAAAVLKPAYADETSIVNSGDNVDIETSVEEKTDVKVENCNKTDIEQVTVAIANTGGNVASDNLSSNNGDGTSVETGDAEVKTTQVVEANKNFTVIDVGNDSRDSKGNSTEIVNTGDRLDVDIEHESETEVDIKNDNEADVDQLTVAVANTGLNFAKDNVGGASIETGDAIVETEQKADVNKNLTVVELDKKCVCPDNCLSLVNTGDCVEVDFDVDCDTDIDIENKNDADVDQKVFAIANTGLNFAKDNAVCDDDNGVEIDTGEAEVKTKQEVDVNKNATFVSLDHDKSDTDCDCPNHDDHNDCDQDCDGCGEDFSDRDCCEGNVTDIVNTGDDLDVDTEVEKELEVNIDNDNELCVEQFAFDLSNSGLNFSSENLGETEVDTGDAEVEADDQKVEGNENFTSLSKIEEDHDFFDHCLHWLGMD